MGARWLATVDRLLDGTALEQAEAYVELRRLVRACLGARAAALADETDDFIHDRLLDITHAHRERGALREATFPGWVKILVRSRFDDWRRKKRPALVIDALPEPTVASGLTERAALRAALDALPADERLAVEHCLGAGHTLAETAAHLAAAARRRGEATTYSVSTVHRLVRRGAAALRRWLAE